MDTLFVKVAGLDVHLKGIQCAVRSRQESGKLFSQVRSFGTMTRDLRALADYLQQLGVTHVAMEATGVLWKPVWNVLEGRFALLLVNPRHLKKVPGRKTDVTDAEWIAQLLQCGLLRGSFVPGRALRDLRDLTRHRAQLAGEHTRVANRVHKLLEDANIKLGAVASDVLGKSGRRMLQALLAGEQDTTKLAEMALGVLRKKIPQLKLALEGHCTEHHRYLLGRLLSHLGYLESQTESFDTRIAHRLNELLPEEARERLDGIPGINRTTIENVIAEIGVDMTVFPDEHHLASWCGLCPGNEESGGRRAPQPNAEGEPVAAAGDGRGRLGGQPRQEELSDRTVPPPRRQARQEAGAAGGGPFATGDHLPCAETFRGVPRPGTGLLRPAGAGAAAALPGQAPATPRLRRDALAHESRRARRVTRQLPRP